MDKVLTYRTVISRTIVDVKQVSLYVEVGCDDIQIKIAIHISKIRILAVCVAIGWESLAPITEISQSVADQ